MGVHSPFAEFQLFKDRVEMVYREAGAIRLPPRPNNVALSHSDAMV